MKLDNTFIFEGNVITNGVLASEFIFEMFGFDFIDEKSPNNTYIYPVGLLNDNLILVDPYQLYKDPRMLILKNNPVQLNINPKYEIEIINDIIKIKFGYDISINKDNVKHYKIINY